MRKVELKIVNSKLLVGDDLVEAGVAVEDGRIVKVAKDPNLPNSDTTIDARGMVMLPGIVDVHVHMRDMNLSYKEDFSSGTQAAVIGGVTTVLDMPNTSPPTTNAERLKEKMCKAADKVYCNIGFFGALVLEPNETTKMANEGAIGFKLYLNEPQYSQLDDETLFAEVIEPVKKTGSTLAVHAEFPQKETKRESPTDTRGEIEQFIESHDPQLEIHAVSKCIRAAREMGVHIHLCHISTEATLAMISKGKVNGIPLTAEVTPHHLLLSEEALYHYGSHAKMVPPLRRIGDVRSLFQGLVNGNIDAIASDHAPHSNEEKSHGFASAPSGVPGLETMLPLLLTEVSERRIPLKRIIQTMCENPPELFRLKGVGKIAERYGADIILVDFKKEKTIDSRTFYSKAKYSPFEGRRVKGVPMLTLVNGVPAMRDGELVGKPGQGKIIRPFINTSLP